MGSSAQWRRHVSSHQCRERDFESTLANRQTPVLVDFSASWRGPCKAIAPALQSFAGRRRNEIAVVKLDIDEAPGTAAKHSIRSVPTLMPFKDGKALAMQAGMMSETQLAQFVDQHLPRKERRVVEQDPTRPQIRLDW